MPESLPHNGTVLYYFNRTLVKTLKILSFFKDILKFNNIFAARRRANLLIQNWGYHQWQWTLCEGYEYMPAQDGLWKLTLAADLKSVSSFSAHACAHVRPKVQSPKFMSDRPAWAWHTHTNRVRGRAHVKQQINAIRNIEIQIIEKGVQSIIHD